MTFTHSGQELLASPLTSVFFIATVGVWECRGRGIPSGHVHAGISCISHRSRRLHPASHRGLAARRQTTWPVRWVFVTPHSLIIKKKRLIWARPDVIALKKAQSGLVLLRISSQSWIRSDPAYATPIRVSHSLDWTEFFVFFQRILLMCLVSLPTHKFSSVKSRRDQRPAAACTLPFWDGHCPTTLPCSGPSEARPAVPC